ncbi:hypothetical protein PCARR_b0136 [Pseudoalteromonas carrageenovora IAM 12662]|uniref:Uncharacterized protein n=1 Tax=Pseudoalteromonas carrageenovora IAM 12662 TaxID=1314868 RepID=A0ABR9EWF5_PSEVC|nr:hypothetical protein [Pseudoalteromonas carrageenovora IAM 12662]
MHTHNVINAPLKRQQVLRLQDINTAIYSGLMIRCRRPACSREKLSF